MTNKNLLRPDEKQYINYCIGPQLQKSKDESIPISLEPYKMNYCAINVDDNSFFRDLIVLVAGFGSGWPGISLLGYELSLLRYGILMPSLLGYGNSDNPPNSNGDFLEAAAALYVWINKVSTGKYIHWVGHSEGAPIVTALASICPNKVGSITLLNPVGFKKRSMFDLSLKFASNGIRHAIEFRGNPKWELLKKYLPREKSPFAPDRLRQRINEWKGMCSEQETEESLMRLRKVVKEKPVQCLYSEKDSLYEPIDCKGLICKPLPRLWHNSTMHGSDVTAKAIDSFIFDLIK